MSLTQQTASGVRWTAASTIFSTLFQLGRIVVLGRLLAPEDFGLMAMLTIVTGFAAIFGEMGLESAIIQRLQPTRNELSSLYWINVAFGGLVYLLLLFITPFIAAFYSSPEINTTLPVVALAFLFIPWGNQFRALLQKELFFKQLSFIEISSAGLGTGAALLLAYNGWGVWSLIYAQLVESGLRTFWLCCLGWRRPTRPALHFAVQDLKGYLQFGLHQVGAMSINYFNTRTDQLMIGWILGPEALGFYSMAYNLVMMPVQKINPILTRVAFPVFAQIQHDRDRLKLGYLRMLNILTTANAPILLGFAAVAPLAVPLILGEKWGPIIHVVQILCFYSLVRATGNPGGSLVMAIGRSDVAFYWNLGLLFVVPVSVYCAGTIGGSIEIIAWSLVCVQACLWLIWYQLVIKKIFGHVFREYSVTMLKPALLAFVMFIGVFAIVQICHRTFEFLLLCIFIGLLIFAALEIVFERNNLKYLIKFLKQ